MKGEQLIQKNCVTGEHMGIYPITTIDNVIDPASGRPLTKLLNEVNHLYVPFVNNTKRDTRLQVPVSLRRKGFWLTYVTCKGTVITEWYNSDATDNASWGDGGNWIPYMSRDLVSSVVRNVLSWYKA